MEKCYTGIPQGPVLSPLLFLFFLNDLADSFLSKAKLFADNTSLFLVIHIVDTSASANELTNDLY